MDHTHKIPNITPSNHQVARARVLASAHDVPRTTEELRHYMSAAVHQISQASMNEAIEEFRDGLNKLEQVLAIVGRDSDRRDPSRAKLELEATAHAIEGFVVLSRKTDDFDIEAEGRLASRGDVLLARADLRELDPTAWARTANWVGNAYRRRFHGGNPESLDRAIELYNASLEVRSELALTTECASTRFNLGVALRLKAELAQNSERGAILREALVNLEQAEEIERATKDVVRIEHAWTRFEQGHVHFLLAECGEPSHYAAAAECLDQFLAAVTPDHAAPWPLGTAKRLLAQSILRGTIGVSREAGETARRAHGLLLDSIIDFSRGGFTYEARQAADEAALIMERCASVEHSIVESGRSVEAGERSLRGALMTLSADNARLLSQQAERLAAAIAAGNREMCGIHAITMCGLLGIAEPSGETEDVEIEIPDEPTEEDSEFEESRRLFLARYLELKARRGLTTALKVADAAGVSTLTIKAMEAGKTKPHFGTMCKIAAAFGVSVAYLQGYSDDEQGST